MVWNRKRQTQEWCQRSAHAGKKESCTPRFCPLSTISRGCRCRICRHKARGAVRQRLLDMGFVPNAEVEVVRVATLGDPLEIRVGDSFITLRKREAEQIEVLSS